MRGNFIAIETLLATNWGARVAVTVKAYYDGSGNSRDQNARFLTLAGYVGTSDAWREFEQRWVRVLQRWGCNYLHMQEARLLKEEFANWTHDRVDGLLADLFNECLAPIGWMNFKGQFYWASCTVNLVDYRKAHIEIPTLKEPEAICVDFVVTIALMALPENRNLPYGKEGTVELFFDKNEPFMHKVDGVWRRKLRKKLEHPLQLVSAIAKVESSDVIGIQAADLLSWSTNRYYMKRLSEKTGAFAGLMRVLASPGYERYYDYGQIIKEYHTE